MKLLRSRSSPPLWNISSLVLIMMMVSMVVVRRHKAYATSFSKASRTRSASSWRKLPFLSKSFLPKIDDDYNPLLLLPRGGGGASTSTTSTTAEDAAALRAYRWQQQLYLQSRSMQLRQELLARGLDGLHHSPEALEASKKHVPVDWDCALATREHPKTCLYSFDAEPGTKVVAPRDTNQWITLSALNRLRRNDPTKVEPLWHSQYAILSTWLNPASEYSMYHYLHPAGSLLSLLLDSPVILIGGMMLVMATVFLVTLPFWESLLTTLLTSSMLWLQWPNWGRFIHAALPFKLLLGQMVWKFVAFLLGKLYGDLRQRLVELECQMWEDCMPLTVLEGRMAKAAAAAAAAAATATAVPSKAPLDQDDGLLEASLEEDDDSEESDGDLTFMTAREEEEEDDGEDIPDDLSFQSAREEEDALDESEAFSGDEQDLTDDETKNYDVNDLDDFDDLQVFSDED